MTIEESIELNKALEHYALCKLDKLKGTIAHSSHIITNGDAKALKDLGINLTCEPVFKTNNLYKN